MSELKLHVTKTTFYNFLLSKGYRLPKLKDCSFSRYHSSFYFEFYPYSCSLFLCCGKVFFNVKYNGEEIIHHSLSFEQVQEFGMLVEK